MRPQMSFERIARCDISSAPSEGQVSQGLPGSEGLADVEYASRAATWKPLRTRAMCEVASTRRYDPAVLSKRSASHDNWGSRRAISLSSPSSRCREVPHPVNPVTQSDAEPLKVS